MRAAAFTSFGKPEVLHIRELDDPQAGAGQVRVRIKAAGVQPYDAAVRAGWEPAGVELTWPRVPGNEFAGVVDQVGDGAVGVHPGEEVLGFTTLNSYAEFIVVPAENVTLKPDDMPWTVAGGFTSGAQTAHIALRELGVGKGDTLLIHGAAGSVGTVAVQLATLWGATVVGTASEVNQEYVRALGAIPVVYGDGLIDRVRAAAPGDIDAALDGAGGHALEVSLDLVEDRGRILTLVEHGKAGELGILVNPAKRSAERLAEVAALYAKGDLRFPVRKTFTLEQSALAHREIETGHGRGKLVITVA